MTTTKGETFNFDAEHHKIVNEISENAIIKQNSWCSIFKVKIQITCSTKQQIILARNLKIFYLLSIKWNETNRNQLKSMCVHVLIKF